MKHESQHPELISSGKGKPFKKSISLGALGLGKLWRRRSVTITEYDPCYKVVYLGNVLTGIAKGEMCVEKPLCSLWKNYTCNQKPDVHMKLTITQSGLKAFTKEHGLTEYWSHRITYCLASPQFPRIFCWVYRHEGRKLKQELRCHAVVCTKESVAKQIAGQLQGRLAQALNEFKRDKISRQNARLSLANSVYENPSLPRRKILLSTGSHNYRPPLERSKSAPRLMSIEESLEEEEEPADVMAAAAFRRCRAENRLRTGTLRNRLGGLHGFREAAKAKAAADAAKAKSAADAAAVNATATVTADVTCPMSEIENRLAETTPQLRPTKDDCVLSDQCNAGILEPTMDTDDESLPSYRDVVAADEQVPSPRPGIPVCTVDEQQQQQQLKQQHQQQQQEELLPKYNEVIVDCPQGPEDVCYKYNSLVRDRKRLFESIGCVGGGSGGGGVSGGGRHRDHRFKRMSSDSALMGAYNNLVKNRKLLFEEGGGLCCRDDEDPDAGAEYLDEDLLLEDMEDKDCGYPDDESTPSLQSISSGGSAADACKKMAAMDLDSLSEEDSDESGYVEAPPARCPGDAAPVDHKHKGLLHKRIGLAAATAVRCAGGAHRVGA